MEIDRFIDRWATSGDAERANKDSFLNELCDVLGVERPPETGAAERGAVGVALVATGGAGGRRTWSLLRQGEPAAWSIMPVKVVHRRLSAATLRHKTGTVAPDLHYP